MRSALAAFLSLFILFGSVAPARASETDPASSVEQVPDIRPFSTAHFEMAGTL
ncbi:MAG: hypothetical protein IT514_16735, partial [Burkholderiales bacterium]|nr:hypothetical protein [Burkholderiales bacterium]